MKYYKAISSSIWNKKTVAMTLVEMIIVMMIIVFLSGTLFWILVAGKRMYQSSVTRVGAGQELQTAFWKLSLDIHNSNVTTLTNNTAVSPSAFSFLSAYDANRTFITDATGAPVWQKYIIYYIPTGTKKLLCKEVYPNPLPTTALSAAALTSNCDGKGSLLSSSITSMSLTPNLASNSVTLTMLLTSTNKNGKIDSQSRTMTLFMRD